MTHLLAHDRYGVHTRSGEALTTLRPLIRALQRYVCFDDPSEAVQEYLGMWAQDSGSVQDWVGMFKSGLHTMLHKIIAKII